MDAEFLVVGGGIGGTVLAELLGRGGKKVVVLERSLAPPNWVRPEILWPATAQVLFSLLSRQELEKEALLPVRGIEIHDGRRTIIFFSPQLLEEVQVQPWSADPNQTRERLLRLGAFELRRGVEVLAVLKEKNRIVGVRTREVATAQEREFLAQYTVGDDGANSVVRKACDIQMEPQLFPVDFLCFGFDWPSSLPFATGRGWLNLNRSGLGILALLAVPLPKGKGAGAAIARSKIFDDQAPLEEAWARFSSMDSAIKDVVRDRKFPHDFVRIRRIWGHAPRYGMEGALLMGDAAHPVSPAGGQGANMSVADACVLADVALGNPPNLLDEYDRRRRPANERSMGFTRVGAFLLELPGWCFPGSIFPWALRWVSRHPSLLRHFVRFASTAFQEKNP